jgi:excisionase family DNA binding protein
MPRPVGEQPRYAAAMEFEAALRKLIADVVREELQRAVAELRTTIAAETERRPTDDEFIDVQGAAELVGLHQSTIRDWIHSGRLQSYRAGRVYRIRTADVKSALERTTPEVQDGDIERMAKELLEDAAIWDEAKAGIVRAAADKGETINYHEVTKRTRVGLRKQFGKWPRR